MTPNLQRLVRQYLRKNTRHFVILILITSLTALSLPFATVLLRTLINKINITPYIKTIIGLFLAHLFFKAISCIGQVLISLYSGKFSTHMAKEIKTELLSHTLTVEISKLNNIMSGEWLSILSICSEYAELWIAPLLNAVSIGTTLIVTISLLLKTSIYLFPAVFSPMIVFLVFTHLYNKRIHSYFRKSQDTRRDLWSFVSEIFDGRDDIRANGYMQMVNSLHSVKNNERIKSEQKIGTSNVFRQEVGNILLQLGLVISLILSTKSNSDPGILIAMYYLVLNLYTSLETASDISAQYHHRNVIGNDIESVLMLNKRNNGFLALSPTSPVFNVNRLSFSINENVLFSDISFTINPGDLVVIQGASGTGKSTLLNLLLGIQHPSSGCVSFYGEDVDSIGLDTIANYIGYMPQHTQLFEGTIEKNIVLDSKPIAQNPILEKLRLDLASVVATQNRGLSGGQVQRVGLLRTIYHDHEVLLLDEPTSSLDTAMSEVVYNELRRMNQGYHKTIIVADHKTNLVSDADLIIRINPPEIHSTYIT